MCEQCRQPGMQLLPEFETVLNEYSGTIFPELEFELMPEISRSSRDYVKWIQSSLNKLLRLSLAVDGIIGTYTRSAIRSFQTKYGLTVDGIVGPFTEAALIKAGAAAPPGSTLPANPPPGSVTPPPAGSLRGNIVSVALQEWNRWGQGSKKESDASLQTILKDYWVTGTGSDFGYTNKYAWSAAFISWVIKKAGGGNNFRYSGAHTTYTYYAKQNRVQNNENPFKAFRITEKRPEAGDIIVQNRGTSTFTYDNVQPDLSGTHGDVVVAVNGNSIQVVGGNLSDSVSRSTYYLNSNGFLNSAPHFAIIKVQ